MALVHYLLMPTEKSRLYMAIQVMENHHCCSFLDGCFTMIIILGKTMIDECKIQGVAIKVIKDLEN